MAIKSDREYRNLGEFRATAEAEGNDYIVDGYASTFDEYLLFEDNGEKFYERLEPTAFDNADMSDVVFLLDHTGRVYARTKNGALAIDVDDHGLHTRTDLSLTDAAKEVYEDIRVGNYTQMSFAFVVDKDRIDKREGGGMTRVIERIGKVYDVSAVSFPANPSTDIGVSARSLFDGAIAEREAERLRAEEEQRAKERKAKALELKLKMYEVNT